MREVAGRGEAVSADLAPEFLEIRKETLFVVDVHPNALGQKLIAQEIYRQLLPQLEATSEGQKAPSSSTE